jgi:hypothetical protein
MFFIYLHELVLGQHHVSCLFFLDILSKDRPVVSDDGLRACLVIDIHDELFAGFGKRHLRPDLKSLLAFVIKLHTDMMYPFIISRKFQ